MGLKYSAGIDKNPVYSVTGFDMFYCTKHITQNVHVHYKFRTYFCYLVELIIFKLINLSQRGLHQEVQGPMVFSVKPAVCCCVYLNRRDQITQARDPISEGPIEAIGPIDLRSALGIVLLQTHQEVNSTVSLKTICFRKILAKITSLDVKIKNM